MTTSSTERANEGKENGNGDVSVAQAEALQSAHKDYNLRVLPAMKV